VTFATTELRDYPARKVCRILRIPRSSYYHMRRYGARRTAYKAKESQAIVRYLFDIYLNFFTGDGQLRITPVMLFGRTDFSLTAASPHPSGSINETAVASAIACLFRFHVRTLPAVTEECFVHTSADQVFLLRGMLPGMMLGLMGSLF